MIKGGLICACHKVFNCNKFISFMENVFIFFSVFFLVIGFVFAADNLSNVSLENKSVSVDLGGDDVSNNDPLVVGDSVKKKTYQTYPENTEFLGNPEDATFYTSSFYIALAIGILVLVGFCVLIWFLIRGPRNSWEKKKSFLHSLGKKEKVPKG